MGLNSKLEDAEAEEDVSKRTVDFQTPSAGTRVPLGSTVRVRLVPVSPIPPWVPIAAGVMVITGLLAFIVRRGVRKKRTSAPPPGEGLVVRPKPDEAIGELEHPGQVVQHEIRLRPHKDAGHYEIDADQDLITKEERTRA